MTGFTIKVRGALSGTVTAEYRCPVHGVFEAEVERGPDGEAPDQAPCLVPVDEFPFGLCYEPSPWTITSAPGMSVSRFSCARGRSDGPRMATDMDTRAMGEGMSREEWKQGRAKVWRDVDYRATKEFLK